MSREVVVRHEAEEELAAAFAWYEERVPGLGAAFLLAVEAVIESIGRNPMRHALVYKSVRQALTRRFPYKVLYLVEESRVIVLAVFHARRNPRRWRERT
ncbi:MAG: type II toxin-antitoxin system RelE/ParE family toxin [Planctomycetes bacterium]|nr:type II toxin-antitoxin system RelE/ParE family toxin [Planctomycetota bacterium]